MSYRTINTVNTKVFSPGTLPVGRLEHLVRAATDAQNTSIHWANYIAAMGHGFPNEGEFRLFPLVAHHLGDIDSVEAQVWLREASAWAKAQSVRTLAAQAYVTPLLQQRDCTVIWTKGTALAQRLYPDPALRPSGDLDAICHWNDLPPLLALAKDQAWPLKVGQRVLKPHHRYLSKELSWQLPSGINIDVCWKPRLPFAFDPFLIDHLRAQAKRQPSCASFADPNWLLLETIEHGLTANRVAAIRWVVDAIRLIDQQDDALDWDLIIAIARRYRLQTMMHFGLSVVTPFTTALPAHVLPTLARHAEGALAVDEIETRGKLRVSRQGYTVSRHYTLVQRAPDALYRRFAPSPFARLAGVPWRLRLALATRGLRLGLRAVLLRRETKSGV